ncbi:MAG: hypothetical protein ACXWWN_04445 [Gemmatimonadales bacterium]
MAGKPTFDVTARRLDVQGSDATTKEATVPLDTAGLTIRVPGAQFPPWPFNMTP